MSDPWDGTFTFLLTDIEGSTRLWESAPSDMARGLARHDELLATVTAAHEGRIIRSRGEGDSAFVAFAAPSDALACAVELQRAFLREPWPGRATIRVRMAVHTGPAAARDDDFFGPTVNRAARLRATAHGGQLIVSDVVRTEVGAALPPDVSFADLGLHRLKDLTRPEHVWQVNHPDLVTDFPALRSLEARRHNLPVQLTTFIGRDLEVREVRKRLAINALLTLLGPGGIGKTRLALQAAAESVDDFEHGIWLVELSPISDPELVAQHVAAVLGVREEAGRPLAESIAESLEERTVLLVLDNCEHVVETCADLADHLLRSSAGLRVLATSREPLGVYGEAVFALPPLELPDRDDARAESATESSAVRLFRDRAELADPHFVLDDDSAPVVTAICRRLDGIPLAIELAAALVRTAGVDEIAGRLTDRLGTLTTGPRTAPHRHRALRATLDWSHDLLSEADRALFARLAVFAGGCSASAAAAVCIGDGIDASDVPALLVRLVERSLLWVRDTSSGTRYEMLDTVHDYASERLVEAGTEPAVRERHLAWCSDLGDRIRHGFFGPLRSELFLQLDADIDNVRTALAWATKARPRAAAELAAALVPYWQLRGLHTEGRRWIESLLAAVPDGDLLRTRLLHGAGWLAFGQGDRVRAEERLTESLALARELRDPGAAGAALNALALAAVQGGRASEAKEMALQALNLQRRTGDEQQIAQALNVLGTASSLEGDLAGARNFFEEALAIARELRTKENVARLVMNLGNIALARLELDVAASLYEEALDLAVEMGDPVTESGASINLAAVAKLEGEYDRALELLERGLQMKRDIGDGRGIAIAQQGRGDVFRRIGRRTEAAVALLECLQVARDVGYALGMVEGIEGMASLRSDEGEFVGAARLSAAADAARASLGLARGDEDALDHDRSVQACRAGLDAQAFDAAWQAGTVLTLDDVVAELLATSP
jgi:predicted ATPase/class 3 adenylate cyclase